jgi:hypothetical protein
MVAIATLVVSIISLAVSTLLVIRQQQADDDQSDAQLRGDDDSVSPLTDQWILAYWVAAGSPSANRV